MTLLCDIPVATRQWFALIQRRQITESGCWEFTGYINRQGYGMVSADGTRMTAHRRAWMLLHGPVPKGMHIDHLCRNRACFNPDHLEVVSPRENYARSSSRSAIAIRTNVCVNGHDLTPENTRRRRNGTRCCIQCANDRNRAWRARQVQS